MNSAAQEARESAVVAEWRVKVWLPDGMLVVQSQKDWTIALLSADTVDWMDGDLKVLVEVDGEQQ
jgi:very-short-patch-repair endonuclease